MLDLYSPREQKCDLNYKYLPTYLVNRQLLVLVYIWQYGHSLNTRQYRNVRFAYLIILGEEFGEFLMPPLRCFFLGDIDDCWSSSTATKASAISG